MLDPKLLQRGLATLNTIDGEQGEAVMSDAIRTFFMGVSFIQVEGIKCRKRRANTTTARAAVTIHFI